MVLGLGKVIVSSCSSQEQPIPEPSFGLLDFKELFTVGRRSLSVHGGRQVQPCSRGSMVLRTNLQSQQSLHKRPSLFCALVSRLVGCAGALVELCRPCNRNTAAGECQYSQKCTFEEMCGPKHKVMVHIPLP